MAMEPDAVVQVLLRERPRVTAVAVAVVRDVHAADDIFQQVALAALEARARLHGPDHLLAWAVRAARCRAIDLARRRKLRTLSAAALDLLEGRPDDDPAGAPPTDRADALHRCLGRLAGPAQEVLRMRYADGLSVAAIADRLGRTTEAVYQTLHRTHRALRACVEREASAPATVLREGNT